MAAISADYPNVAPRQLEEPKAKPKPPQLRAVTWPPSLFPYLALPDPTLLNLLPTRRLTKADRRLLHEIKRPNKISKHRPRRRTMGKMMFSLLSGGYRMGEVCPLPGYAAMRLEGVLPLPGVHWLPSFIDGFRRWDREADSGSNVAGDGK